MIQLLVLVNGKLTQTLSKVNTDFVEFSDENLIKMYEDFG